MLVPIVGLMAMASTVSDVPTEKGAEYCVAPAVGVVPSVL
jgi:hypothetical protein